MFGRHARGGDAESGVPKRVRPRQAAGRSAAGPKSSLSGDVALNHAGGQRRRRQRPTQTHRGRNAARSSWHQRESRAEALVAGHQAGESSAHTGRQQREDASGGAGRDETHRLGQVVPAAGCRRAEAHPSTARRRGVAQTSQLRRGWRRRPGLRRCAPTHGKCAGARVLNPGKRPGLVGVTNVAGRWSRT